MLFSEGILVTSRLNMRKGLADSFKANAAEADMMMQQLWQIERTVHCRASFFQPDSFLCTIRLHDHMNGCRGSKGFSNVRGTPGFAIHLSTYD
jgi:hypothetical protein